MRKGKNSTLVLAIVALVMLNSAVVLAHDGWGHGGGGGHWGGGYGLDEDQQKKAEEIAMKFEKKVIPLRNELYAKRMALDAEMLKEDPNNSTIKGLTKDISKLQTQLLEQRIAFRQEMNSELEMSIPMRGYGRGGRGWGHGGRGWGHGGGRGWGRGGGRGGGYGGCPGYGY